MQRRNISSGNNSIVNLPREERMSSGYVYVLVNASMPGLVKVGKTTRDPQQRVAELSSSTGVPTPFMLAFQSPVSDCDTVEMQIHALLESRGIRESANREFFRGDVSDVIRVVLEIAEQYPISTDLLAQSQEPHSDMPERPIWLDVEESAMAALDGMEDGFSDPKLALERFEVAIKLGSPTAPRAAASLLRSARARRSDESEIIRLLREGAKRGDVWAYGDLATAWLDPNSRFRDPVNAARAFTRFYQSIYADWERTNENTRQGILSLVVGCFAFLELAILPQDDELLATLLQYRAEALSYIEAELKNVDSVVENKTLLDARAFIHKLTSYDEANADSQEPLEPGTAKMLIEHRISCKVYWDEFPSLIAASRNPQSVRTTRQEEVLQSIASRSGLPINSILARMPNVRTDVEVEPPQPPRAESQKRPKPAGFFGRLFGGS